MFECLELKRRLAKLEDGDNFINRPAALRLKGLWGKHFDMFLLNRTTHKPENEGKFDFNFFLSRLSKNLKIKIDKTIILPVMLHGCESWDECRLREFENRILRRIFGPTRDANGEWRSFHNEKLHILYRSPNIVNSVV